MLSMELSVKEVTEFLCQVQSKWYGIGVELDISTEVLDSLKHQWGDNPARCLEDVARVRLNQSEMPQLTWKDIASVLKNAMVSDSEASTTTGKLYFQIPSLFY